MQAENTKAQKGHRVYKRKSIVHIVANGSVYRAPEDTRAKVGEEVFPHASSEKRTHSILVMVDSAQEEWSEWTDGKKSSSQGTSGRGRRGDGERRLYKRKGTVHVVMGGVCYARPDNSSVPTDARTVTATKITGQEAVTVQTETGDETWSAAPELSTPKSDKTGTEASEKDETAAA